MVEEAIEATGAPQISNLVARLTPIRKAELFGIDTIAGEPVLSTSVEPVHQDATFIITVALRDTDRLRLSIAHMGTSEEVTLNSGFQLQAGCLYSFSLPVLNSCKVNLNTELNNRAVMLIVHELGVMV